MKAKSWKNLVKKKRQQEGEDWQEQDQTVHDALPDSWPLQPEEEGSTAVAPDAMPSLEQIASQNEELGSLLNQREELEQKMAHLLGGGDPLADPATDPRFAMGEIPSQREKQRIDQLWDDARKRATERLKKEQEQLSRWEQKRDQQADKAAEADQRFLQRLQNEQQRFSELEGGLAKKAISRLSPKGAPGRDKAETQALMEGEDLRQRDQQLDSARLRDPDSGSKRAGAHRTETSLNRPERHDTSTRADSKHWEQEYESRSKSDDPKGWEQERDSKRARLQKAKKTATDIGSTVGKVGKQLGKLADGFADMDRKLDEARAKAVEARKAHGMDSGYTSSMDDSNSLFAKKDELKDKIRSNPLVQQWEKVREKKKEVMEAKKKYESLISKALNVDLGNMDDLAAKADALRQKALEKRKQQQAEERKEEERRERRRQQKKERY